MQHLLLDIICTMIEKFGSQDFNKIKSKGLGNIREHYIGKVLFITLTEWLSKREIKGKWLEYLYAIIINKRNHKFLRPKFQNIKWRAKCNMFTVLSFLFLASSLFSRILSLMNKMSTTRGMDAQINLQSTSYV